MPIGPALPPHLAHLQSSASTTSATLSPSPPAAEPARTDTDDDEDDDAFGPALPPHLAAARKGPAAGPSRQGPAFESPSPPRIPSAVSGSSQRSVGPSRPSGAVGAVGPSRPPVYDDDSDDDVIGPVLPSGPTVEKSAVEEFREREERMRKSREEQNQPKKPQREEWMLLPPTSGLLASMTDPLRKRPSTFSRNNQDVDPDSTVWTETPQEKLQRLADEQAGIKRKKGGKAEEDSEDRARKRIRDDEIRRGVEKHNASVTMLKVFAKRADGQKDTRGKTLLEQHAERDKKGEEPKAIWDHARDMGVTGRLLSEQERGEKIREAKNLNDRFGHSKRGAYDM